MNVCPECDGEGWVLMMRLGEPGRDVLCPVCDGVGHMPQPICHCCARPITGVDGDSLIVVERADGTNAIYCRRCAPTLVGLGDAIDNARAFRSAVAAGARQLFRVAS